MLVKKKGKLTGIVHERIETTELLEGLKTAGDGYKIGI